MLRRKLTPGGKDKAIAVESGVNQIEIDRSVIFHLYISILSSWLYFREIEEW